MARNKARRTAGELNAAELQCRALQHHWQPELTTIETWERRKVRVTRLHCNNECGVDAVDVTDSRGARVVARSYEHGEKWTPVSLEDYGGDRKEWKNALRAELYGKYEGRSRLKVVR